jgi:hypothetical protein
LRLATAIKNVLNGKINKRRGGLTTRPKYKEGVVN